VGLAFVAEVAEAAQVTGGGGESGQDFGVGAHRDGVVLAAGSYLGGPDRPAVWGGDDLDVAAVVGLFCRPPQVDARGWAGVDTWSVSIRLPSMLTWL
jgi:hypothetical protein